MKNAKRISAFLIPLTLVLFSASAFASGSKGNYLLYVGTYTEHASKGIYAFRYQSTSGEVTPLGLVAETANPSFLTMDSRGKFLYAVNELTKYEDQSSGALSAFSIDRNTAKLTLVNQVTSRGADPCYLTIDHTGKYVLVANYTGGNIAAFPVTTTGGLGTASGFIQHKGVGVNPERQEGPHAHSIDLSLDNRFAVVSDLGLDELLVYRFDAAKGSLTPNTPPFAKVAPGAGPRHFAFHPNGRFGYEIDEMASTVTSFSYDSRAGVLKTLQSISTLPKDFSGKNESAEIQVHPSGKFLYASNRGHDSIAVFAIDSSKGTLTLVEIVSTQGKTPRNFTLDPTGSRLFAANQDSGTIVAFNVDPQTGRLTPSGKVLQVPDPVCIKFMAID
jgi:6-phosphogluconolactonase